MMRNFIFIFMLVSMQLVIGSSAAAWIHMAHAGETLEQLSIRYYGTPDKAVVIRAANGFVHPDNGRLTEGEPVEIPEILFWRVVESDTWAGLANTFLSSAYRAPFLAEMNGFKESQMPPVGTVILVPFHLRHIFAADESLKSIVSLYYRNKVSVDWLIRYNSPSKKKYGRGEVIIAPLKDLEFTKEEQARVDAFREHRSTRHDLERQDAAREVLATLKDDYDAGKYVEMVSKASNLLGCGHLTVPQEIGIHNYLAYAYVALDETKPALASFKQALALQPDMELSPITSSPKILEVFKRARKEMEKVSAAP